MKLLRPVEIQFNEERHEEMRWFSFSDVKDPKIVRLRNVLLFLPKHCHHNAALGSTYGTP